MNHNYAHCLDCTDKCPDDCFRAELTRDLKNYPGMPVTFFSFYGTCDCVMTIRRKPEDDREVQLSDLTPECIDAIADAVVAKIKSSVNECVVVTRVDDEDDK